MRKSRAFTLVELLVVVAIIVILIALLVPFLGRAKEGANTAKCQSNLHQIGLAIFAYAAHQGAIPVADYWHSPLFGQTATNTGDNLSWPERLVVDGDVIDVYAGNGFGKGSESQWATGIFICPNHNPALQGPPGVGAGTAVGHTPDYDTVHYGENDCDGYGINPQMAGQLMTNVNPSHILAADACYSFVRGSSTTGTRGNTPGDQLETGPADDQQVTNHSWYGVYLRHPGSQTYPYPTYTDSASGTTITRIRNGSNYLFGDNHIEWSVVYGHISMQETNPGAAASDPTKYDRPAPWNYWLNP